MHGFAWPDLRVRAVVNLLFLLPLGAALACGGEAPPERIVLVSIDTLRADRVGVFGAGSGRTPTLDAIAARGARFTQAISPAPLTLPSHTTLLTGRAPYRHGVHHNGVYRLNDEVPTLAERMQQHGDATAAFVGAFMLDRQFGLARGFDVYDDQMAADTRARGALQVAQRPADAVASAALAWLAHAPARFFLFLHFYDPHAEYVPPPPFDERFPGDPYAGEIAFVDAQLGDVLAAIERRYPKGGTLIVVVSDHGESLYEHGEPTHSYGIYETTQHVPLLMAGPGVPENRSVDALVRLEDVAPTLLELDGAPALDGITGRSLVPLLAGAPDPPRAAYLETLATRLDMGWSALYGLRTARWKYIRAPRPELYDLLADPGETRNLAIESPDRLGTLDRELSSLLEGAGPAASTRAVDPADRAKLEQLGYVVPAAGLEAVPLGEVGGVDPKDEIASIAALAEANGLLGNDRPRDALARLANVPPRGAEVHRLRVLAALAAGDLSLAKEAARAALAEAPDNYADHILLGLAHERAGEIEEAEAEYRRAAALAPDAGAPALSLGRLAEQRGDRARAEALYREARESRSSPAEATWRLAALRVEEGARDEAFALLDELSGSTIAEPGAALRLALAELAVGRQDLALLRVDGALRQHPRSVQLLRMRGGLLERGGDSAGALRAREEALAVDPADPASQNDLAWSLALAHQDLDRALALARGAIATAGRQPQLLDTLATVLVARGDRAEAERVIGEALPQADEEMRAHLLELRSALSGGSERDASAKRAPGPTPATPPSSRAAR